MDELIQFYSGKGTTLSPKRQVAAKITNGEKTIKDSNGRSTSNITFDSKFTEVIRNNGFYDMKWKIYRDAESNENSYVLYPETVTSVPGLRKFGTKNKHMSLMQIPVRVMENLDLYHMDTYLIDIITSPSPMIILRDRNVENVLHGSMSAKVYLKAVGEVAEVKVIADKELYEDYRADAVNVMKKYLTMENNGGLEIPYFDGIIVDPKDRHCDHIFSCKDGYLNDIPPDLISHPSNLQFMENKINISKNAKSWCTLDEFKQKIVDSGGFSLEDIEKRITTMRNRRLSSSSQ